MPENTPLPRRPLRVCVLQSGDAAANLVEDEDSYDPSPLLAGHDVTLETVPADGSVAFVEGLVARGFDVFVNLCDGAPGQGIAGVEVVRTLERLGAAFTGADAAFYAFTKARMREAAARVGVPVPAGFFAWCEADLEQARALRFPLIAKHHDGYSSVGMTPASRVTSFAALQVEARRLLHLFGGVLVEEFVEGGEMAVLVVEDADATGRGEALQPIDIVFPPGETFKHHELKFHAWAGMSYVPCPDPARRARAMAGSVAVFEALGGRGYARCDWRVDAAGTPIFLEINANCGIFYKDQPGAADEILARDPLGSQGFMDRILQNARARVRRPPGSPGMG